MARFRLITIISAALSSLVAFFVITRSGLAGTLAGAAVAAVVSTATSHWSGQSLEHVARRVGSRKTGESEAPHAEDGRKASLPDATEVIHVEDARKASWSAWRKHPWLPVWICIVLVALAGGASMYSIIGGRPIERVIVHDYVIEKPIVQERLVIEKVPSGRPFAADSGPPITEATSPSGTLSTQVTPSSEAPSTTTTLPVAGTEAPSSSSTTTSIATPDDS